jgi:hypothetical protein
MDTANLPNPEQVLQPDELAVALDEVRRSNDALKNFADGILNRSNVILGFTGTILAVVLGTTASPILARPFLGIPGVGLMAGCMILCALQLGFTGLKLYRPSLVLSGPPGTLRSGLIEAYILGWELNRRRIRQKSALLLYSLVLLVTGTILVMLAILV